MGHSGLIKLELFVGRVRHRLGWAVNIGLIDDLSRFQFYYHNEFAEAVQLER